MFIDLYGMDNKSAIRVINEVISLKETAFELTGCILDQRRVSDCICTWSSVFLGADYTIISSCRAYSMTCCASSVEGMVTSSVRCC